MQTFRLSLFLLLSGLFPGVGTAAEPSPVVVGWEHRQLDGLFFSEGASHGDIDGDGIHDIISGPYVYFGPAYAPEKRVAIYEAKPFAKAGYSDNFFSFLKDFNHDGNADVLVLGFPGKDASWYENPGKERLGQGWWKRHLVLEPVDNETPTFADLTGDGKPEIICSQNGIFGYAGPDEADPARPWVFHAVSPEKATGGKFTHGMGIGDVNGDGRADLLEKNAWWEQPASLSGDPIWERHLFAFSGPGGADMFAYDFDGDGDNDILTSLAAHGYGLAWYEQVVENGAKGFRQHLITGQTPQENAHGVAFSQLHAIALADVDGDGVADIVTGKRHWAHNGHDPEGNGPAVLYWFRTVRLPDGKGVDFVPYLIDGDSGVGTDVVAEDVNGDGLVDVLVGNKKGTFLHLQRRAGITAIPVPKRPVRKPMVETGLTASEAVKQMSLTEGFEVTIVAEEPEVRQPIALAIDERGRLWVAEAYAYPVRQPEGQGRDRILIFADQDGDGRFETRKVFAEHLNLVSGLEVGFGGVWVGAAPELLFIPDADRDDVPDGPPQILLDGWGQQDTHETLNSFIWGPDGWLYGCHGVFTHSQVGIPGTPEADRVPMNAGVWRYHPVRHEFEVFAHGTSNPWGLDFDANGEAFITACVIPHLYHMVQGGRYQRQGGQHFNPHTYDDLKTIADHLHYAGDIRDNAHWGAAPLAKADTLQLGGGHAHCGLVIYQGDQFPEEYRGKLLFTNLHGHGIISDYTVPEGSGFIGKHGADFLHTNDRWSMPVEMQPGPDGSLFVIDWYDKQNCHRRDAEIWDRSNGRLYRVTYGQPKATEPVDLSALTDADLVALQTSRNAWHQRTASRLLQERAASGKLDSASFGTALTGLAAGGDPAIRLRALWLKHVTGGAVTSKDLQADDAVLRSWAVRLKGERGTFEEGDLATLLGLADDASLAGSATVRRHLASLLDRLPKTNRWDLAGRLVGHGEDATDHNIPLLLWYGVEPLVMDDPDRALVLARASKIPLVRQFILRRLAQEDDGRERLLTLAAKTGTKAEERMLILDEITTALQDRTSAPMPKAWDSAFTALAGEGDAATRQKLELLGTKFGDRRLLPRFRAILGDPKADPAVRENALSALLGAKDPESVGILQGLASGTASPFRGRAIRALGSYADAATPEILLKSFATYDPAEKAETVNVLASNVLSAKALLTALADGQIPRSAVSAFHARQIRSLGDEGLKAALERHWGKVTDTSEAKKAELARYQKLLTPAFLAKANLGQGRALFNQTCFACHSLFGQGNAIGPDLTGGNRQNLDFLLENILDPSAVVGADYQLTVFTLKDGRVLSGMPRQENENAVRIALLGAAEQLLPKADIVKRESVPVSMMPEGILAPFKDDQVRDLVAYLQSPIQVRGSEPGEVFWEGESLKVVKSTGSIKPQGMGGFKKAQWSGNAHLWWTGAKPANELVLEFTLPEDGTWELFTTLTKARDYGIITLKLDGGGALLQGLDLFNEPDVITTGEVNLGRQEMKAGTHTLHVLIDGANPKAVKGYMVGIDYLRAVKR